MKLPSTYVYIPLPNAIPSLYQIIFFTVQGSECSNTWLLQILRTNDCWVLSPKRADHHSSFVYFGAETTLGSSAVSHGWGETPWVLLSLRNYWLLVKV